MAMEVNRAEESASQSDLVDSQSAYRDKVSGKFLPGNRASPGRPRNGSRVTDYVENAKVKDNKAIAKALIREASNGSIRHIETVMAYQSGTPVRRIMVAGPNDSLARIFGLDGGRSDRPDRSGGLLTPPEEGKLPE